MLASPSRTIGWSSTHTIRIFVLLVILLSHAAGRGGRSPIRGPVCDRRGSLARLPARSFPSPAYSRSRTRRRSGLLFLAFLRDQSDRALQPAVTPPSCLDPHRESAVPKQRLHNAIGPGSRRSRRASTRCAAPPAPVRSGPRPPRAATTAHPLRFDTLLRSGSSQNMPSRFAAAIPSALLPWPDGCAATAA